MVRKIAALIALVGAMAGFMGAGSALAIPATQQRVSQSINISAPPDKVWGLIKNFNDMSWHPVVKSDTATNGNTVGSIRTLDLGGPKLIEALTAYDEARKQYKYKITDDPNNVKTLPVTKYSSTITVKAAPKGTTTVVWSGQFMRADNSPNPAAGQDDKAAIDAVTGVYKAGLDNIKKLAETPAP
ncbi:MAG TPA: SRPBCC family protein [Stellaceae bacterium]|nr:SRPBCC family protein [Stellaceae bacterium]